MLCCFLFLVFLVVKRLLITTFIAAQTDNFCRYRSHSLSASSTISQLVDTIFKSHPTAWYIFPTSTVLQERNLHTMAFCALPLHNSLYHPFLLPFTSPIMPLSHACSHLIIWLMQLLFQSSLQLLQEYIASRLPIL